MKKLILSCILAVASVTMFAVEQVSKVYITVNFPADGEYLTTSSIVIEDTKPYQVVGSTLFSAASMENVSSQPVTANTSYRLEIDLEMDEDGYVFYKQRIKRVIKVSGVGVFPTEIEKLIENIPGVEACCAIQIPDPRLQSAVKVFVVAKYFDEQGMINQIMDTCRKYLIRWAIPKEIEFVDSLPKTLLGKIDFKVLQKQEDEKRGITR